MRRMIIIFELCDVDPDRKTIAIRRTGIRDTSASRHHGGTIEDLPETPLTITTLSY